MQGIYIGYIGIFIGDTNMHSKNLAKCK